MARDHQARDHQTMSLGASPLVMQQPGISQQRSAFVVKWRLGPQCPAVMRRDGLDDGDAGAEGAGTGEVGVVRVLACQE
eukprot:1852025-Rhodomonas_salina.2